MKNFKNNLDALRDLTKIQGKKGNQTNEYMRGMYNGMEFVLSMFEGREPKYKVKIGRVKR